MRILLISANRTSINMPVFPLGLACLGASLQRAGHAVEALDLLDNEDPDMAIGQAVTAFRPQLIGLSVRNIDNQDRDQPQFFLADIRRLIQTCRRVCEAPIVVGGAGYSIFPRPALDFLQADYGIVGEGEQALGRLAHALETGAPVGVIPGLLVRGRPAGAGRRRLAALDRLPAPARELLPVARYAAASPMPIQGKRGCHRRCIYCSSPLIEGRRVRLRSCPGIVAEIETALDRYGINRFFFVDSLFNYPVEHAIGLCQALVRRGLRITWQAILNPRWVTRPLVRAMKQAGCVEVSLGLESGSDRMLRVLRKGFRAEDVRRASHLLAAFQIRRTGFLLLGGPGEDRRSVADSFALAESLRLEAMKITVGLRIYPGTALAAWAARKGLVAPGDSLLEPTFYLEPGLRDWLPEEATRQVRSHPGWRR